MEWLITCGPRDLMSPRLGIATQPSLAFTLNALGIVLGSSGSDICGSVSPTRSVRNI